MITKDPQTNKGSQTYEKFDFLIFTVNESKSLNVLAIQVTTFVCSFGLKLVNIWLCTNRTIDKQIELRRLMNTSYLECIILVSNFTG